MKKSTLFYLGLCLLGSSAYGMEQGRLPLPFLDLNRNPEIKQPTTEAKEIAEDTSSVSSEGTPPALPNDDSQQVKELENNHQQEEQIKSLQKDKPLKKRRRIERIAVEPEATLTDVVAILRELVQGQTDILKRLITLEQLLAKNVSNAQESKGTVPDQKALIQAIKDGNTKKVNQLLRKGADSNSRDKDNMTPLMLAARYGLVKIATALLTANADIEARNLAGDTALIIAVRAEQENIAQLFINNGASIDITNYENESPLSLAIQRQNQNLINMLNNALPTASVDRKSSEKGEEDMSFEENI